MHPRKLINNNSNVNEILQRNDKKIGSAGSAPIN